MFRADLLAGRVALVSGGGTGLGRATALELAACGARVVVCGRRLEPLEQTAALAGAQRCEAHACDIRDEGEVAGMVDLVLERHGRIDVLVNNAGGQYMVPAEDITPKGFQTVMRLNVEGTWLMTHTVASRSMIPGGHGGRIVNVTLSPHTGLPGMAHSSAARAAVENLTRVLATEWARFGIRLTAIAAGHFATDTFVTKYPEHVVDGAAATIPLQRLGRPEEVAWLVAYLASDAGEYVSGAVLTVDGGRDNWRGAWPPPDLAAADGAPPTEARRGSAEAVARRAAAEAVARRAAAEAVARRAAAEAVARA